MRYLQTVICSLALVAALPVATPASVVSRSRAKVLPADTDPTSLATAVAALLDGLALHAYVRPEVDFTPAGEAIASLLERK